MYDHRNKDIKKAQKESLLLREISGLLLQGGMDDPRLQKVTVSRVSLSDDKSTCTVFFYTSQGKKAFEEILEILKLYKPSLRTALAKKIRGRYTPNLVFRFDDQIEKSEKMNALFEQLKEKGDV
jgi:ribosome-binding factor A